MKARISAISQNHNMAKVAINLVWHKCTDLRVHDHECIALAHADGLPVVHLFCLDPFWWQPLPLTGHAKTGAIRTKFLLECLDDLKSTLGVHGQSLLCVRGPTASTFKHICECFRVVKCFAFAEVCSEEQGIERSVARVLQAAGAFDR